MAQFMSNKDSKLLWYLFWAFRAASCPYLTWFESFRLKKIKIQALENNSVRLTNDKRIISFWIKPTFSHLTLRCIFTFWTDRPLAPRERNALLLHPVHLLSFLRSNIVPHFPIWQKIFLLQFFHSNFVAFSQCFDSINAECVHPWLMTTICEKA